VQEHFSVIQIEQRLRSLLDFSRCSAIIFESRTLTYVLTQGSSRQIAKQVFESGSEKRWASLLQGHSSFKAFPLPSGKLIFVDPSPSMPGWILEFQGRQLEQDIQFAAIIDTVFQASLTISSDLDLEPLLHKVMSLSEEILKPDVTAVILTDWEKRELYWEISRGEKSDFFQQRISMPLDQGIGGYVARTGESVLIDDVRTDPRWNCSYDERTGFCTRSMICVPVKFHGEILGVIEVINKKEGPFTSMDLRLLEILAAQAGSAIKNALLFQEALEKQRMEKELAIARNLQMSMLPSKCPTLKGFEIAAHSMPAREVGGDFYDFIELGGDRLGLVIGDVTGKSVSGALVVAAARSMFRMLSEEQSDAGEIMVRANRRTKRDMKSGMSIAMLYAVIDGNERGISFSSAGQMQPVCFSAESGEAKLVDTSGDTFPLGIFEDSVYKETYLELSAGDKVVFYTDGIVEAMNDNHKIYGFERLIETVKNGGGKPPGTLLNEIMDRVNSFVGSARQYDDLTVIVVEAE
jgi:sigma-B regulation protein RsbU (phosphoserine phosphatase)